MRTVTLTPHQQYEMVEFELRRARERLQQCRASNEYQAVQAYRNEQRLRRERQRQAAKDTLMRMLRAVGRLLAPARHATGALGPETR